MFIFILKPKYLNFAYDIDCFFFFNTIVGRTFFDTFDISYYGDFKWKMKSPSRQDTIQGKKEKEKKLYILKIEGNFADPQYQ